MGLIIKALLCWLHRGFRQAPLGMVRVKGYQGFRGASGL